MCNTSKSGNRVRAFRRDTRGSVAITFALMAVLLSGFVGLSVDIARGWNVSARIGQGLDGAGLAGARKLDEGAGDAEIRETVQRFFNQYLANLNIAGVTLPPLNIAIDRTASTIDVRATGSVNTTFAAVVGFNTMQIDKSATVRHIRRKVELILALDVTGSMATGGKIEAMKLAAADVIDTVYSEAANDDQIRIGLVPWASSVNAGVLAGPVTNYQSVDNCVIERTGAHAGTAVAPYGANRLRASPGPAPNPYEFYFCPPNEVIPLVGRMERNNLKNTIQTYIPTGGTAGHIGMAWGHYLLSPDWASFLPPQSRPRPYDNNETLKVLVLLTDGEFNMSYLTPGVYNETTQAEESYQMFQALCTDARSKDVMIYTVGFQLTNMRAMTELEACSANASQHFAAATNAELQVAFKQIAMQIMQLRVTR
jgi:Flp pilus assembly protein TadG